MSMEIGTLLGDGRIAALLDEAIEDGIRKALGLPPAASGAPIGAIPQFRFPTVYALDPLARGGPRVVVDLYGRSDYRVSLPLYGEMPVIGQVVQVVDLAGGRAFVQTGGGSSALTPVDYEALRLVTDEQLKAHAKLPLQATPYTTPNTLGLYAGQWSRLATGKITARWGQVSGGIVLAGNGGSTAAAMRGTLRFRVRQEADFGSQPVVTIDLAAGADIAAADLVVVVTSVGAAGVGPMTFEIHARVTRAQEWLRYGPLYLHPHRTEFTWTSCSAFTAALPAGTQSVATAVSGGGGVTAHSALTGLGADDHPHYQREVEKDAALGYAGLDASIRVPVARLGSGTPGSGNYLRGDGAWATFPFIDPDSFAGTDDQKIQAARTAAEAIGPGAKVLISRLYSISTTILCSKGIYWASHHGWGDVGGANPTTASPGFLWIGAANGTMIRYVAPTFGDFLHGGGIVGLLFDGNNSADYGIRLTSTSGVLLDNNFTYRTLFTGVRMDADNDALSSYTMVPRHKHRLGANTAAHGSHGIDLVGKIATGSTTYRGFTNHWFGFLDIEREGGDGLRFGMGDTCTVVKWKGADRGLGGLGADIRFRRGDLDSGGVPIFTARKHVIVHCGRGERVIAEPDTANQILYFNSEGGKVEIQGNAVLIYNVQDRLHGDMFEAGTRYPMVDRFPVMCDAMRKETNAVDATTTTGGWPVIDLPDAVTSAVSFIIPPPREWNTGTIEGITLHCTVAVGGATVNTRVQLEATTATPASVSVYNTIEATVTATIAPRSGAWQPSAIPILFATPLTYERGDSVAIRLTRLGADALDTTTKKLLVTGIDVLYACDGPNSSGSPSDWGRTNDQIQ